MARKYKILVVSLLGILILNYFNQAFSQSWQDLLASFGIYSLCIGGIEILIGIVLLLAGEKTLGKEILFTGLLLILIGAGTCTLSLT